MSYINYNNKRIPRELFRTFVYGVDENGNVIQKLAESFDEFKQLVLSRNWFEHKHEAQAHAEKMHAAPEAQEKKEEVKTAKKSSVKEK